MLFADRMICGQMTSLKSLRIDLNSAHPMGCVLDVERIQKGTAEAVPFCYAIHVFTSGPFDNSASIDPAYHPNALLSKGPWRLRYEETLHFREV